MIRGIRPAFSLADPQMQPMPICNKMTQSRWQLRIGSDGENDETAPVPIKIASMRDMAGKP